MDTQQVDDVEADHIDSYLEVDIETPIREEMGVRIPGDHYVPGWIDDRPFIRMEKEWEPAVVDPPVPQQKRDSY